MNSPLTRTARPYAKQCWTVEEIRTIPEDGFRYEIVRGRLLVSPPPAQPHQMLVADLTRRFQSYLEQFHLEASLVKISPPISWDDRTLVYPDIVITAPIQITSSTQQVDQNNQCQELLLALEVTAPISLRRDRWTKRRLYQAQHVHSYWVVNHKAKHLEIWQPTDERPEIVKDVFAWRVAPYIPTLEIKLSDLWGNLPKPQ